MVVWLEDLRRQSWQEWTSKRRAKGRDSLFIIISSHKRYCCGLLGLPPAVAEWHHVIKVVLD